MKQILNQLIEKENLSAHAIIDVIKDLVLHQSPELIAAFLISLRSKGESVDEMKGLVNFMQDEMLKVEVPFQTMDIVGTGGDHSNTVNLSTASAIVAASCGVKIAKHGSRSVSSQCGSADVIQALGLPLLDNPQHVTECIQKAGIGFMFAPHFHPVMKVFSPVRRSLKVRTIFNMIGPLLNPANAKFLMIGVYHRDLMSKLADVLQSSGQNNALIFHGQGMDELTCVGPAEYIHVGKDTRTQGIIDPRIYGLPTCTLEDLQGGNAETNAKILEDVFQGKSCPVSHSIALNAGVAQYLFGTVSSIEEGIMKSQYALKEGKPYETLETWRNVCKGF